MMTIALTAAFASAAPTPWLRPSRTACDRAFTGGELIVTTPISPSMTRSATELMAAITCFLWKVERRGRLSARRGGLFYDAKDMFGAAAVLRSTPAAARDLPAEVKNFAGPCNGSLP